MNILILLNDVYIICHIQDVCMLVMSPQCMRTCTHIIIVEACRLVLLQIGKNCNLKQKLIVLSSLILRSSVLKVSYYHYCCCV